MCSLGVIKNLREVLGGGVKNTPLIYLVAKSEKYNKGHYFLDTQYIGTSDIASIKKLQSEILNLRFAVLQLMRVYSVFHGDIF